VNLKYFFFLGFPVYGISSFSGAETDSKDIFNVIHISMGGEFGLRLYNGARVSIAAPLGYMYTETIYATKEKLYVQGLDVQPKRVNRYHSLFTGIEVSLKFNKYVYLTFFSKGAYPVNAEHSIEFQAPAGYVWVANDKDTLSESTSLDVFYISTGLRIQFKIQAADSIIRRRGLRNA
jgi:hypothetical protein